MKFRNKFAEITPPTFLHIHDPVKQIPGSVREKN